MCYTTYVINAIHHHFIGGIRGLYWGQLVIKVIGEYHSNLRCTDDIALLNHSGDELQSIINGLDRQSSIVGVKINMEK